MIIERFGERLQNTRKLYVHQGYGPKKAAFLAADQLIGRMLNHEINTSRQRPEVIKELERRQQIVIGDNVVHHPSTYINVNGVKVVRRRPR